MSRAPSTARCLTRPTRPAQRLIPGPFPSNVGRGTWDMGLPLLASQRCTHFPLLITPIHLSGLWHIWHPRYRATQHACKTEIFCERAMGSVHLLIYLVECRQPPTGTQRQPPPCWLFHLGTGLCRSRLVPDKHQAACYLRTLACNTMIAICYFESSESFRTAATIGPHCESFVVASLPRACRLVGSRQQAGSSHPGKSMSCPQVAPSSLSLAAQSQHPPTTLHV